MLHTRNLLRTIPPAIFCLALLCSCSGIIEIQGSPDVDPDTGAVQHVPASSDTTKSESLPPDAATVRVILNVLNWEPDRSSEVEYIHFPDMLVRTDPDPVITGQSSSLSVMYGNRTYSVVLSSGDGYVNVNGDRLTARNSGYHDLTVAAQIDGRWFWRNYTVAAYDRIPVYMYIRAKDQSNTTYGNSQVVLQNYGTEPLTVTVGVKASAKPLIGGTKTDWLFNTTKICLEPGVPFPLADYSSLSSWVKKHLTASFSLDVQMTCEDSFVYIDFNADNIQDNITHATNRSVDFYYNGTRLW